MTVTRPQPAVASGSGTREEDTPIDAPSSSTREEGELPSYWERPASAEKPTPSSPSTDAAANRSQVAS
jgi:hypothetical protein